MLYWYWLVGLVLVVLGILGGFLWGFENYHRLKAKLESRFVKRKPGDLEENGALVDVENEVEVEPVTRGIDEVHGLVGEGGI